MSRKVFKYDNHPPSVPLFATIVMGLLLDRLDASGVVWGIVGTLFAALWIGGIYSICTVEQVDIFKDKP